MIHITNNPELSAAFRSDELKVFLRRFLEDLHDAHALQYFLREGAEKIYENQIKQLSKSFVGLRPIQGEKKSYHSVIRCIDSQIFDVGDMVIDLEDPNGRALPISLMYEDDRGLHVRLDVDDKGTITWRDLSRIEHLQPKQENKLWWIEEGKPILWEGVVCYPTSIALIKNNLYNITVTSPELNNGAQVVITTPLVDVILYDRDLENNKSRSEV